MPAIYREIFETCSSNGEPIHRDVFKELLSICKLETTTLKIIWDLTGPSQGLITRTNLYKALALVAWAQEGKTPSNKLFENFSAKGRFFYIPNGLIIKLIILILEYPTPELTDLTLVKNVKTQLSLQSNLAILGLSYSDIKQLDTINVELVPEKKGLIIKYSEYIVTSRRFGSKVTRRYNDFVALNELLLGRFPYRYVNYCF